MLVSDLGRAEAFYTDLLGLAVLQRLEDPSGLARSVWLDLGQNAFLALELAAPLATRENGMHCVALAISPDERETWRQRLHAAHVTIEKESPYTLYFRDPDGHLLGLSHYPDPTASGSACAPAQVA